jgi:replicative DNA helicase
MGIHLIASLLVTETPLSVLSDRGVNSDDFTGDEEVEIFDFVRKHYLEFKQYPSRKVVKKETRVTLPIVTEPFDYYLARFLKRKKLRIMKKSMDKVSLLIDEADFDGAEQAIVSTATSLRGMTIKTSLKSFKDLAEQLVTAASQEIEMGASFGLDFLDVVTHGAQDGDFVVIAGRPSAGKTYFLLNSLLASHRQGKKTLLVTTEMTAKQCARRLLAMIALQHFDDLRRGRISPFALKHLKQVVKTGRSNGEQLWNPLNDITILDAEMAGKIEDVDLLITEINPDVALIDGAYSLGTENKVEIRSTSDRVSYIAVCLKQIALRKKIPVITTYQFNKKGVGLDNIFQSDVVGQLATLIIGIDKGKKRNDYQRNAFRVVQLVKGREGEEGRVRVKFSKDTTQLTQDYILDGREEYSQ